MPILNANSILYATGFLACLLTGSPLLSSAEKGTSLGMAEGLLSNPCEVQVETNPEVGNGYDIYAYRMLGNPFIKTPAGSPGNGGVLRIESSELYESMRSSGNRAVAMEASGKYGSFKGSLQASVASSFDTTSESYCYFIYYSKTFTSQTTNPQAITEQQKKALATEFKKSPESFIGTFGTHYISSIERGFSVLATITVKTKSAAERRAVSLAFSAKFSKGVAEATSNGTFESDFSSASLGLERQISVLIRGLPDGNEPVVIPYSVSDFMALVKIIPKMAETAEASKSAGVPVKATVRPYSELMSELFTKEVKNDIYLKARFSNLYAKHSILHNRIIRVLGNKDGYIFSAIDTSLKDERAELRIVKEWLNRKQELAESGQQSGASKEKLPYSLADLDDRDADLELINVSLPRPRSITPVSSTNENFTSTGFYAPPGTSIRISTPSGAMWGYGPGGSRCPLSGSAVIGNGAALLAGAPIGALIVKCGSSIQIVGTGRDFKFPDGGELFLAHNDGPHDDNVNDVVPITISLVEAEPLVY